MVSYTRGQKFDLHHDAGTLMANGTVLGEDEAGTPRRLVTVFVYLTTMPENVGCTEFPKIGVTVQPVRGKAVFFCNVCPDGQPDSRLVHRGCPVLSDELAIRKLGLNIWISDKSLTAYSTMMTPFDHAVSSGKIRLQVTSSLSLTLSLSSSLFALLD